MAAVSTPKTVNAYQLSMELGEPVRVAGPLVGGMTRVFANVDTATLAAAVEAHEADDTVVPPPPPAPLSAAVEILAELDEMTPLLPADVADVLARFARAVQGA